MSKRVSEEAFLELTFLAALDSIHADVDTSEIAEIQDWSRAVRGKFYGAAVKDASDFYKLKSDSSSASEHPNAANEIVSSPAGSSGIVLGGSSNVASHGSVQYAQMAFPQLIAACTSESSEGAWSEFILRFQPFIARAIARVVHRFGEVSRDLVDDLTQDTFLKLCHDNLRALRGFVTAHENSFQGFLKVVATNTAQDYFRSAASVKREAADVQNQNALEADHIILERGDDSSKLQRESLLQEIDEVLKACLHESNFERDYAIFWLYYSHGLSAKEISTLPNVKLTVKGVESTLFRLTQQIRSALAQRPKNPQ